METWAYFTDIPAAILDCLRPAEREILVAAAEFTNREIFDLLCQQAARKVKVSVLLVDDAINRGAYGK